MKMIKMFLVPLALAGAWSLKAEQTPIPYLEPVFDAKGAVTNYETKLCTSYTVAPTGEYKNNIYLDTGWYVFTGSLEVFYGIIVRGTANVILTDGCRVDVDSIGEIANSGVHVINGASLTIYAQSTGDAMGHLYAQSRIDEESSGIGGSGVVTINGGRIEAKSRQGAYGGGICVKSLTINGGDVTATGNSTIGSKKPGEVVKLMSSAGIGGVDSQTGENITINGGTVTATGGSNAAGIGGGCRGGCKNITINGGTVIATGGNDGAGIGTGDSDYDSRVTAENITINGGTVTATGKESGAGIGGGQYGHASGITINGGLVTATGGPASAGIGGGGRAGYQGGYGKNITIRGGMVMATGGEYAAGIGGANRANGYDITISGGKVTATGGSDGGAAIGGGANGQGYNLTFAGGTVSAELDSGSEYAAIGSGKNGTAASNIRVMGGSIHSSNDAGLFGATAYNAAKEIVLPVPISDVSWGLGPVPAAGIPNYGLNDLYPDILEKKLYFKLPKGDYQFAIGTRIYTAKVALLTKSVTSVTNDNPVLINNLSFLGGSGDGWIFEDNVLTLNEARAYTLTGADLYGQLRVVVTANATVTLNGATLKQPCQNVPCIAFATTATDAKLVLMGDNTVYSQDDYPAVDIQPGAKVTLSGTGALVGGKASGVNSRGIYNNGTLVMSGGTIKGYISSCDGGAVYNNGTLTIEGGVISDNEAVNGAALANNGMATIAGGTISNNTASSWCGFCYCLAGCQTSIYGGVFAGNRTTRADACNLYVGQNMKWNGRLSGGVFAADPTSDKESRRCLVLQDGATVNKVGTNWIVGSAVTQQDNALTGGTYTFDPTKAEYAAAGVAVADKHSVASTGTGLYRVMRQNTGLTVNGQDLAAGSGDGWRYDDTNNALFLTNAQAFVLSGASTGDVAIAVQVTACATVSLDRVTLVYSRATPGITFASSAIDAKLVLVGDSTVYSQDGYPAVDVATGAKVTISGTGALVGGRAASKNSRCVNVNAGGILVLDSGTICNYYTTDRGAAVCNRGTASILGGTFTNNNAVSGGVLARLDDSSTFTVYGGVITGNLSKPTDGCSVCGLVSDTSPEGVVSGLSPIQVGDLHIVGSNVTQRTGALTGGTYTFDPSRAEYAAAGVTLADRRIVEVMGTVPETYRVHVVANFQVDGVRLENGTGKDGWTFTQDEDTGYLTLTAARPYELTGYADLTLLVDVLSNATVTLNGARIRAGAASREIIRVSAADATIVLKGTNTFYTTDGHAAIGVTAGAKLTLAGGGELVGGRTARANGRCVTVEAGGAFVMDGGTIREYSITEGGGAIHNSGRFTMNRGTILTCSAIYGGVLCNCGSAEIYGGMVGENEATYGGFCSCAEGCRTDIYGGLFSGNTASNSRLYYGDACQQNGYLYGGVFTADPTLKRESGGCLALQNGAMISQVGDLYVVAANLETRADESEMIRVLRGDFTFSPTNAEYATAGIAIIKRCILLELDKVDHRLSTIAFSTNNIGVCSWSWATNMTEVLNRMKQSGVKNMSLALSPWLKPSDGSTYQGPFGVPETDKMFEEIRNKIATGEITVPSTMLSFPKENWGSYESITNTVGIMYTDSSDPTGSEHWTVNSNLVEQAAILTKRLNVEYVTCFVGFLMKPIMEGGVDKNADGAIGLARLKAAQDLCAKHSVTLLLESGHYSGEVTTNILAAYEQKYGAGEYPLAINFDAANHLVYGNDTPRNAYDVMRSRIKQVHIKDANRGPAASGFAVDVKWGTGEVSTKYDLLKYLRDDDYDGHLLVECEAGDTDSERIECITAALQAMLVANNTDPADKWVSPTVVPGESEDECCENALKAQGFKTDVAESLGTTSLYASFRGWAENKGLDPNGLTTKEGVILASAYDAPKVEDPTNVVVTIEDLAVGTNVLANAGMTLEDFASTASGSATIEMTFMVNVEADGYNGPIDENLLKASLGVEGTTDLEATAFSPDALNFAFGTVTEGRLPVTVIPKKVAGESPDKFFLRTSAK